MTSVRQHPEDDLWLSIKGGRIPQFWLNNSGNFRDSFILSIFVYPHLFDGYHISGLLDQPFLLVMNFCYQTILLS